MYKVILIDDEKPALSEMAFLLKDYENYQVIGSFSDPRLGVEAIRELKPDLVFLDIDMPGINGFQVADAIVDFNKCPVIVFATAYDEYAIKAFEINATDYLLKPILTDRLKTTLTRVEAELAKQGRQQVNYVKDTLEFVRSKYIKKLPLWKNNRIRLVSASEIRYCSVDDGETFIFTEDEGYITSDCLNTVEELLKADGFFRCHRSYLVKIHAITEVIPWFNNTFVVKVHGLDDEIPISRRKCQQFKQLLNIK